MVGWHHRLNGHGFGWTPGVGDGEGGLACCGSWTGQDLEGFHLFSVLFQHFGRGDGVVFADGDGGHAGKILFHLSVTRGLASAAGQRVFDDHILDRKSVV